MFPGIPSWNSSQWVWVTRQEAFCHEIWKTEVKHSWGISRHCVSYTVAHFIEMGQQIIQGLFLSASIVFTCFFTKKLQCKHLRKTHGSQFYWTKNFCGDSARDSSIYISGSKAKFSKLFMSSFLQSTFYPGPRSHSSTKSRVSSPLWKPLTETFTIILQKNMDMCAHLPRNVKLV